MSLKGGNVYVEFAERKGQFSVSHLGEKKSVALVNDAEVEFDTPPGLKLAQYCILSKLKKENNQTFGQVRGSEEWKPVKLKDGNVPYVECDGMRKDVINEADKSQSKSSYGLVGACTVVGAVGAVGAVVAAPFVVSGLGFTAGGIAAGSYAASMMSAGVVGVSTLQSIGAAGMGLASTLLTGGSGAALVGGVTGLFWANQNAEPITLTEEGQAFERRILYQKAKCN